MTLEYSDTYLSWNSALVTNTTKTTENQWADCTSLIEKTVYRKYINVTFKTSNGSESSKNDKVIKAEQESLVVFRDALHFSIKQLRIQEKSIYKTDQNWSRRYEAQTINRAKILICSTLSPTTTLLVKSEKMHQFFWGTFIDELYNRDAAW